MTMREPSWYDIVEQPSSEGVDILEQGDILVCPRFVIETPGVWPLPTTLAPRVVVDEVLAVVLTQTCDLAQDKVREVLLAAAPAWSLAVERMAQSGNEFAKSKAFRKALVDGNLPSLHLLHRHDDEPQMDWTIVDFHSLFTLPKPMLLSIARSTGPRLRLRPPYKEHLAQAFARFFMRVGLPLDARSFIDQGRS